MNSGACAWTGNVESYVTPNQSPGTTISPACDAGMCVRAPLSNRGGSSLRAQLVDPRGKFWCRDVGDVEPVTMPLTSFNTTCWNSTGGEAFVPGTPSRPYRTLPRARRSATRPSPFA